MTQISNNLKNKTERDEHYRYRPGRPTDAAIAETIRNRVRQIVANGYRGGRMFTTEQLTHPLWDEYPRQHHYISQQIERLIKEYKLPIRYVCTKSDNHVLRTIVLDAL